MRNDSQIFTLYDSTFKKLIYSTQLDYRSFISFMMEFREIIYQKIHKELYPKHLKDKNVEIQIRMLCQYVSEKIYPNFCRIRDKYLKNNEVEETIVDIFDRLEDDLFAIISCRSLKHFALYIDRDKNYEDLVWEKGTLRIFENYFFYANSMILKNNIDLIQASYFPGAGKSYAGDLTTAYWLGYNPNMSFLRITYNDDLTKSFIKGTADIIKSERFKKVFPQFDLSDDKLFKVNKATEFQLCFSRKLSVVGSTTLGKGSGFRARVLILDDVIKDAIISNDVAVQEKVVKLYDYVWRSRADSDNQKVIALGTMWSYYDLLNTIRNRALKKGIFKDKKYKYTLVDSENPNQVRNIFISTPALDYSTDESTLPERYNTAYFRNIRSETNDKDMFEAVYQQNPVEPPQFIFGWSRLMKGVPLNLENYETFAMIDPVREGQNYFAMAILRRYKLKDGNWSKCYLIDVIYKFDTNDHCLPYVVQKIVTHNIIWLGYETNVDLSFTKLIKIELKNYNYFDLEIKKIYTNKNKQAKISMARYGILNEIIYPPQELFSVKSEFGLFMAHLTTWQFFGKNAYDDSPDCLAMFVQEAPIFKKGNKKTLYVVNRIL